MASPEQVPRYFARSTRRPTRRIAISDRRLVRYDGRTVVFRWRDRSESNRPKLLALDGPTFCERFLQHVLPSRFVRIRRYGLLSNRVREGLLRRTRALLNAGTPAATPPAESRSIACRRVFGVDLDLCPQCRKGRLVVRATWNATRLPLDAVIATLMTRAP